MHDVDHTLDEMTRPQIELHGQSYGACFATEMIRSGCKIPDGRVTVIFVALKVRCRL